MHRPSRAAALLIGALGALSLSAPARSQGQPPGLAPRAGVEIVQGREAVAGEALVKLRRGATPEDLVRLSSEANLDAVELVHPAGIVRVRSRGRAAGALVAQLARRGDVEYAEPNYIVRVSTTPDDP